HRRVYLIGVALFTTASVVCGAAQTATVLIAARVAQGIGAGLLVPQVLSIVQIRFVGAERTRALGLYGLVLGLASVAGQIVGGVLILVTFIAVERAFSRKGRAALLDVELFQSSDFCWGLASIFFLQSCAASMFLVLTVFLQDGHGYTPIQSGLTYVPLGLAFA